jgi:RNA polymerase sigma-70 factor (ECF subfamily)
VRKDDAEREPKKSPSEAAAHAELIVAIANQQDRAAFKSLFEFYAPRIKTWLIRRGAAPDLAEETAQDALLTIWKKAAQFDPNRATPAAWIFTIARNLRIDKARRDNRERLNAVYELQIVDEAERPDDILDADEAGERIRAALGVLSAEQMRVVQLSFFEGRAHNDIAQALNIPLGTVKSRLRLAMRTLRQRLGDLR